MRTIGLILIVFLLVPLSKLYAPACFSKDKSTASFIIPSIKISIAKQHGGPVDTASLKQSSWYANAIHSIEESEYGIKYDEATASYASPNRKQNLRSFYSAKTFILLPRNDSMDKWKLELTTLGVYANKQLLYSPAEKPAVSGSGGTLAFNHDNNFITEYVNSKEGVRQNFIVQKEPASKPQTLHIKLKTSKGWLANKVHDKEIHFAKQTGDRVEKKLTYNDLKVWDANKKELEASFAVANNEISIIVKTTEASYPITIDPLSSTANTTLQSNVTNALFGRSVASAGDVNGDGYGDVVVGAAGYENGQAFEGAMYIYHGSATGISTTPAVTIESNQANATYGFAVNTAGDVNGDGYSDIIVGSHLYDNGEPNEGRAYIYHGSASGIIITPAAILESNQDQAAFGVSVACAGDVNNDGYSDVIVGAQTYDNVENDEGAAFIYHGFSTGIITTAVAVIEANLADSYLGVSVAGAGDVNGDGYSDVIIGARSYADGEAEEGHVFIHHGSAAGIVITPATTLQVNQVQAQLGMSVSTAGDVNGDGYSDIIAGAHYYDNVETQEGAAFIHHGSAAGISNTPATTFESNQADAQLGASVNCIGDINGDGYSEIAVGAILYDNIEINEGRVFVYSGSATGINPTPIITYESNQDNAQMYSVASAGDVNGDGYSDMIAGSYRYTDGETNEGHAFVYHGSPDGLSASPNNIPDDANQADANFGVSVASAGDINGDGFSDVIIGAWLFDDGGNNNEGVAFVYHGSATGLPATPYSMLDDADQAGAFFGETVGSAGDVNGDGYSDVIIGADNFDDENTDEGRAFVYHGSAAGISASPNWFTDDANQNSAFFGVSVASAGDVNGDGYGDVIVGAIGITDGPNANEGRAYVYHGSATGLSATPNSTPDDANLAGARFGWSVAGAGDVNGDGYSDVIIGALDYNAAFTSEGRAYVYQGGITGLGPGPTTTLDDGNQSFAQFGIAVATAGDVNGDGYSDVIVGAIGFDGSHSDEGQAFVYHGSSTGVSASPNSTPDDADQTSASFGISVASAGDVNGDGYSDVIIGARYYDDGFADEGRAFVYYGSSTGLSASPNSTPDDANEAGAWFGYSVACAGDVNGDGYSDVIVGAHFSDDGTSNEGRAFVYYGNNTGGLRNNLRLYNIDLVTPIQWSNIGEGSLFGAGLYSKSFVGRTKGRMTWEVIRQGLPFSGIPITNSTLFLSKQSFWTDLGITGTELKNQVQKAGFQSKIRTRVEYDKATAITGQVYGPWRYPPTYLQGLHGMSGTPLPVRFISFVAIKQTENVLLKWVTADETTGIRYEVEHSTDGNHFRPLVDVPGVLQLRNEYQWLHTTPHKGSNFYRIRAIESDKNRVSATRQINFTGTDALTAYPQPVSSGQLLTIKNSDIRAGQLLKMILINISGQMVWTGTVKPVADNGVTIRLPLLSAGIHQLRIMKGNKLMTLDILVLRE